ncbi:AEC family transporter [Clostridium sp. Marseille-P2415]|uniref:AEC family transporter n=1 Tax=Clostridium sp. Marseille-P2415 TaxID=1805471 RepID=UPI0009886B40|nr:AEC family transporter [Clostridium sp. Marseille-P2415]
MAILTICNQIIILFVLMAIGFFLSKKGIIDNNGSGQMTTLLCYIVLPCTILYSFQMEFREDMLQNFLLMCLITAGIHAAGILITFPLFNKKNVPDKEKRTVLRFSSVYSNCGFMGLPLLEALVGQNGLFYGAAFNSIYGLFLWTHGLLLFSGKADKKAILKAIINPNILASIIGLFLYCFSISLPRPLYLSVKYLAQMNTALSMIVIGTTMTQISFRKLFSGFSAWIGVLMRNMVIPLTSLLILYKVGVRGELLLSSLIPAACPVAGFAVIFSKFVGRDVVFPSKIMTLSTLSSLITMPVILGILNYITV